MGMYNNLLPCLQTEGLWRCLYIANIMLKILQAQGPHWESTPWGDWNKFCRARTPMQNQSKEARESSSKFWISGPLWRWVWTTWLISQTWNTWRWHNSPTRTKVPPRAMASIPVCTRTQVSDFPYLRYNRGTIPRPSDARNSLARPGVLSSLLQAYATTKFMRQNKLCEAYRSTNAILSS